MQLACRPIGRIGITPASTPWGGQMKAMWQVIFDLVTCRRGAVVRAVLLALGGLLWAPPGGAQCALRDASTPMTFTGYVPWGAGVSSTANIRYRCVGPASGRQVSLSIATPRTLAGPNALDFELYPQGSAAPFPEAPPLSIPWRNNDRVTVQGVLGAPQDAAPGLYQTTLVVTLYVNGIAVDTASLLVATTVARQCAIYPATLAFGIYDPIGPNATAPRAGQTQIEIQCTRTTQYAVTLDGGGNYAARRQMGNGAGAWLGYDLFSDPALSVLWLPGQLPPGMPTPAPSITRTAIPVYGQIPQAQPVPTGTYQDVVLSTINF
jgi:spore coat protein U-like protein